MLQKVKAICVLLLQREIFLQVLLVLYTQHQDAACNATTSCTKMLSTLLVLCLGGTGWEESRKHCSMIRLKQLIHDVQGCNRQIYLPEHEIKNSVHPLVTAIPLDCLEIDLV